MLRPELGRAELAHQILGVLHRVDQFRAATAAEGRERLVGVFGDDDALAGLRDCG